MRTIDMPPYAPILMELTRSIGYSVEAAIADVIDNSIAAFATNVEVNFFPSSDPYICILDNGNGMTISELENAMQYGSKNPLDTRSENDLGRYGLGLKTASLSQCRKLTVISKKNDTISGCRWDLDYIKDKENWALIVLEEDDYRYVPYFDRLDELRSGTLVVWQDLDKFAAGERDIHTALTVKMDLTRNHLALVFHRYLSGESGLNKLKIVMNGHEVEPKDPFLIKKSNQLMAEESIIIRGQQVKVTPYILPHVSNLTREELDALGGKEGLRKSQGFYVYRNKRLICWGTWFRLMRQGDLSKLARVQVDIPNSLDDLWTLDIKKSTAIPPDEVKKNLAIIIDKISAGSKRTWTYRGKKETKDDVVHLWTPMKIRGSKYYTINRDHPLVESIIEEFPESRKKLDTLLEQIGLMLPLNSLYVDLTNDEKLVNESEITANEAIENAKLLLANYSSVEEKKLMLSGLKNVDMFLEHYETLVDMVERGEL